MDGWGLVFETPVPWLGPGRLLANIAAVFANPDAGLPPPPLQATRREAEIDRASERDKGHGRIEKRTIEVTSALGEYLRPEWEGYCPSHSAHPRAQDRQQCCIAMRPYVCHPQESVKILYFPV